MKNIMYLKTDELIPYENNPRNNDAAVEPVMNSIEEFGFKQPIIIDKDKVIIAGHTRLRAAKRLGLDEVPCIMADDLTQEQVKAFRLADNKVAEFADWDVDLMNDELDGIFGIDMESFGFIDKIFEEEDEENPYTAKVNIPQYEVKGDVFGIGELYDTSKADELIAEIQISNIEKDEKDFLIKAAERHNVFNYRRIAEYYAGASKEMQSLMEKSALVIIDYGDAIRNGYVKLNKAVEGMLYE